MKTLKENLLRNVGISRIGQIEKWLKEHGIENYTINKDFTIDVNGSVYLSYSHLHELPVYIQFNIVKGDFDCRRNDLKSLKGTPKEVGGWFDCSHNRLTSLEGAPEKTEGSFGCDRNELTSLKGAPKEVGGGFNCDHNKLTSLEGAPEKVKGYFDCSENSTKFTEGDVREVCNVKREIYV